MLRAFCTAYGAPSGVDCSRSTISAGSRSSRRAKDRVSAVASVRSASQLLRTSLARVPWPAGPSQAVARPSTPKTGASMSRTCSGPLARMTSSPAWAGPSLPETGASTNTIPRVGDAGEPGRPVGSDGGHLHPYRPRSRLQQAVRPGGGLLGGGPVGQHGDDDRGAPDGFRGAVGHDGAVRGEGCGAAAGAVPHAYGEAATGQVGGHRGAHAAGAEERDGWCGGRDGGHVVP